MNTFNVLANGYSDLSVVWCGFGGTHQEQENARDRETSASVYEH
jgi:hypothetical protein